MKRVGYLRVSTAEQRTDRQFDALKDVCDELHIETVSAVCARRPVYERVIRNLRGGDVLVVWDLDRAFRSVVDALTEAEKLRRRGIDFHIASLHVDTRTPAGIFVYTMLSALAEFERRTLSQRTREGLAAARRRGKRLGRPPKLSEWQLHEARLRMSAETITAIAADYDVAPWTLSRSLKRVRSGNPGIPQ
ncbi:recombinase family protein [Ancylobacter lacus]|uniref:recombinase family protein n=1 Tax=Ancylobacter lacus TaxID=2579970 RepID=UPI001BCA9231|nr:recombinase family protein [Ancylobacter lacus]MBS7537756.1 recombinase family protein [Ancylobacter lacus]